MKSTVLQSFLNYFKVLADGYWSLQTAAFTSLPYLFGIGKLRNEVTEQYPDPVSSRSREDLPPRFRGLLYNDKNKCTGCKDCQEICPAKCIRIITEPGLDETKAWVSVFEVDFGKCIFCGLCVEVCEPKSLEHTRAYEGAVHSHQDFKKNFGRDFVTEGVKKRWDALRKSDGV